MTNKTKAAIKRAYATMYKHESACAEVLFSIEHMLPDDDDYEFSVFMQTDGLCISDRNFKNYPVDMVIDLYEAKNGRLTYDDLWGASI